MKMMFNLFPDFKVRVEILKMVNTDCNRNIFIIRMGDSDDINTYLFTNISNFRNSYIKF